MTEKETVPVIPFGNLRNACLKHGLQARLDIFDGGQTVTVYDGATVIVTATSEHGDKVTAPEQAALHLLKGNWLWAGDFEG